MSARDQLLAELAAGLSLRRDAGLLREPRQGLGTDFTSNDYLGLARDAELAATVAAGVAEAGTGMGGSRLLSGEGPLPRRAEALLAGLSGQPAAVLFSSGYAANLGLLSALAGPADHVLSDSLNHASLIDGMRLSGAAKHIFPHGDLSALDAALQRLDQATDGHRGRRLVVVESVWSMDGDLTDLRAVCDIAEQRGASVVVDEAHATGMYGARGSGRVEALGLTDRVLCTVHTGGKALGSGGAWVAGPEAVARQLHNYARSFIYSTAPVPALMLSLMEAVRRLPSLADRVQQAHRKAADLRVRLMEQGYAVGLSDSCIIPVIVGDSRRALDLAERLNREGFDVRAIRPPTVPEGAARLRLAVNYAIPDTELRRFADLMAQLRDTQDLGAAA